jgi:hypothetical protein
LAGGCLPRRHAGEGSDSGINLGIEIEEGKKVDVELRNTSNEVRDASVDEEVGVINVGGDAAGGSAAASLVADPNGKGSQRHTAGSQK